MLVGTGRARDARRREHREAGEDPGPSVGGGRSGSEESPRDSAVSAPTGDDRRAAAKIWAPSLGLNPRREEVKEERRRGVERGKKSDVEVISVTEMNKSL